MSIANILKQRAEQSGAKIAYTFINGEEEQRISYGELYQNALRLSACLREMIEPGDRVVLLCPPGLNFIAGLFGCFLCQAVAVPAYPPGMGRSGKNLKRLQGIVADAQPKIALYSGDAAPAGRSLSELAPQLGSFPWINLNELPGEVSADETSLSFDEQSLALLQYTSGSTSDPKGVMVTHANLMHNLQVIRDAFRHTRDSRGVIWLPPYHDMGLIGGILQPLYAEFPVFLMTPTAFLQKPYAWLKAISNYRGTTSGGPSSAYRLCVNRVTEEQKATLDLNSWTVAFNGAEPVDLETINAFSSAFATCGFRREAFLPCYGLAEATLMVTGFRARGDSVQSFDCSKSALETSMVQAEENGLGRPSVACGSAESSTDVKIVDLETNRPAKPDKVGEIWVSSPSVAIGYWGKPELSEKVFRASFAEDRTLRRYLRTGDLGFLREDRLHVVGRLKDLIIVRGVNHHPHDIELTVAQSHPALAAGFGAAFSIEADDEVRLVIVHEVNRHTAKDRHALDTIISALRAAIVREHHLAVYAVALVKSGGLPRTTSGKVQRQLCKTLFLNGDLETIGVGASWKLERLSERLTPEGLRSLPPDQRLAEVESYLKWLVTSILKPEEDVLAEGSDLQACGLDSLMFVDLQHRISRDTGVQLEYGFMFRLENLNEVAAEICSRIERPLRPESAKPPVARATYPLSYNQKALWFLYQMAPADPAYNLAAAARLQGNLDLDALFSAFRALVQRHGLLGVRFTEEDGEVIQSTQSPAEPSFVLKQASDWKLDDLDREIKAAAATPFDLRKESPVKIFLFKCSAQDHVLVWVTHHLVADFWSFSILFPELEELYRACADGRQPKLPPVKAYYHQYVEWQTELVASPEGTRLKEFWKNRIRTMPQLPLGDHAKDAALSKSPAATYDLNLDHELADRLRALAAAERITLNELLLAAFQVLLYRYTGEDKIVLGIPCSGRVVEAFRELVGYCVTPVLVDADFEDDMPFRAFCHGVKERVRSAIEHQSYPLPLIFQALGLERLGDGPAGIQVMFVFHNAERLGKAAPFLSRAQTTIDWGKLFLQPLSIPPLGAQFELTLNVVESRNNIQVSWQYRADLFERCTIEQMARHWNGLLANIVADPKRKLLELGLLSGEERHRLLIESNDTAAEYPRDKALHKLFEEQAERTPDALAVIFEGQRMTYRELDRKANQVAHYLKTVGVGPEALVPICMERSLNLVIGLLGVLKAGGAYVPLDPAEPPSRLDRILDDVKDAPLLTETRFANMLAGRSGTILDIEDAMIQARSEENLDCGIKPDNLAYVIYTSGSTGTPKGAMNTHRGIGNRLHWMQQAYQLEASDRVLQKTPYTFDVSVWEFFWPLIAGACIVLARPGGQREAGYLIKLIEQEKITTLHFVPPMLQVFLDELGPAKCSGLKRVFCSGEALPLDLTRRFYEKLTAELHNLYGPTEASVDVTYWACPKEAQTKVVPIGKPIANVEVYILDGSLNPVPRGVRGEIYLGGTGLGRGYLNRPDLTAARFIPNPFGRHGGERLYRTGDVGRYLADGNIEYLGRSDHQVKVRGYRIELGEIENCLKEHPAVRESVVVVGEDRSRDRRLIAYVVPKEGSVPLAVDLRAHASSRLPEYMVPATFVPLTVLPLTPHGKVDRKALPEPPIQYEAETPYEPARTDTQRVLVQIVEDVLGQPRIGINDNFFHVGGNSLLMTRVANKIRSELGFEIPLGKFFSAPTVAGLANLIQNMRSEKKNIDEIGALLDELENLSTEQVEERLQKLNGKDDSVQSIVP